MARRLAPLIALIPAIWVVLAARASSPALLQDTDTAVLIAALRERASPLSWFVGDWPLQNHFYRPISTLVFELDLALYGANAAGYGFTNALLAALCVLALSWFVGELTRRAWLGVGAGYLLALWLVDAGSGWLGGLGVLALPILAVGIVRHRRLSTPVLVGFLVALYLAHELSGITQLQMRIVGWLPGRTASTMTLFALIALAAYARYKRLRSLDQPRPYDPLEPPSTKSARPPGSPAPRPLPWLIVAFLATALALGSYEQAVMLPAVMLCVAVALLVTGSRPVWRVHAGFWAILLGYVALRTAVVPSEVSGYQDQQLRFGPGVGLSMADYLLLTYREIASTWVSLQAGLIVLLTLSPLLSLAFFAGNLATYALAARKAQAALALLAASALAFLPMAFLKHFDHYHLWPMALRAAFLALLAPAAAQAIATAVSPPELRAPARPDPAPGSRIRP